MKQYKTESLLKKLERYDEKYREAINKPSNISWGYGMRAYHAIKVSNPPEWKIKDKAKLIKEELENRGVQFNTYWV